MAGFGGMRDHDGPLSFTPRLPERLTRLAFGLTFRARQLRVEVDHRRARYTLVAGAPLDIEHHGKAVQRHGGRAGRPRDPQAALAPAADAAARAGPRYATHREIAHERPAGRVGQALTTGKWLRYGRALCPRVTSTASA